MPYFKDIDSLLKYAQKQINQSLQDDVAPVVETKLQEKIIENVYDPYSPTKYDRRNELSNEKNIVSDLIDDGKLFTKNVAVPDKSVLGTPYQGTDPTCFARWVNDGLVPNIFNNEQYPWQDPALFVEETVEDLQNSGEATKALQRSLGSATLNWTEKIGSC